MKFVTNPCAKTVILLVSAKISYLTILYYQATNASSVQCCSTQTDRQYLATAPGDKKMILQCLVIKVAAASYNKLDII